MNHCARWLIFGRRGCEGVQSGLLEKEKEKGEKGEKEKEVDGERAMGGTSVLAGWTVGDVVRCRESVDGRPATLVHLAPLTSVAGALRALAAGKVLSAPVVGDEGRVADEGRGVYHGFCDVRLLLGSFLGQLVEAEPELARPDVPVLKRMRLLEDAGPKLMHRTVAEVLGDVRRVLGVRAAGGDGTFRAFVCDLACPLDRLLEEGFLADCPRWLAAHRVAVGDPGTGRIADVVSQTDVLRFLRARWVDLPFRDAEFKVADLGLDLSGAVTTVSVEEPVLLSYLHLAREGQAAAAVVDPSDGTLVANLSASDLRGLRPEHCGELALNTLEYLATKDHKQPREPRTDRDEPMEGGPAVTPTPHLHVHGATPRSGEHTTKVKSLDFGEVEIDAEAISSGESTLVRDVVDKLLQRKVHRVYVVDEGGVPRGVVTMTDIIASIHRACIAKATA